MASTIPCDYVHEDADLPDLYIQCGSPAVYQLPRGNWTAYSCANHVGVFVNHILGQHASAIEVRLLTELPTDSSEGRRN